MISGLRSAFNTYARRLWRLVSNLLACFFPTLAVAVVLAVVFEAPQSPEITSNLNDTWRLIVAGRDASPALIVITFFSVFYCALAIFLAAIASIGPSAHRGSSIAYVLGALTLASAVGIVIGNTFAPWFVGLLIATVFILNLFDPKALDTRLPLGNRYLAVSAVLLLLGAIYGLLVGFFPIDFPRTITAWSIIYVAIGFWTLLWTLGVVALPRFLKISSPAVAFLALGAIALTSSCNDDHRLDTSAGPVSTASPLKFESYVVSWLRDHCPRRLDACTVTFIAAQGGGQRALYWTAGVLAKLHDIDPGFDRSIFAFSGVSGGAIGGLAYFLNRREVADKLLSDANPAPAPAATAVPTSEAEATLNRFARADNLSPIIGGLLYANAFQAFLPREFDVLDRARAFEHGVEVSWRYAQPASVKTNNMAAPFPASLPTGGPLVFLNSTMIESGERIVDASAVFSTPFPFRSLPEAVALPGALRSSTAGHLSARFSWVNPHATVYDKYGRYWGRLVDGGYNENTGLLTLLDVLDRFDMALSSDEVGEWRQTRTRPTKIERRLIYISNDPKYDEALDGTVVQTAVTPSPTPSSIESVTPSAGAATSPKPIKPNSFLWELIAPVQAEINQDSSVKDAELHARILDFIAKWRPTPIGPRARNRDGGFTVQTISLERIRTAYNSGQLQDLSPVPEPNWCSDYANWNPELGWWLSDRSHFFMDRLLNARAAYTADVGVKKVRPLFVMSNAELAKAEQATRRLTGCASSPRH